MPTSLSAKKTPMIEVESSGAEPPAAMKVAPATSSCRRAWRGRVQGWVGGMARCVCRTGGKGGIRGGQGGGRGRADLELEVVDDGLQRGHEVVVADDGESEEGDNNDEKLRTVGVGVEHAGGAWGGRTAGRDRGGIWGGAWRARRAWKKAICRFSSLVFWVCHRSGKPVSSLTLKAEPQVPEAGGAGDAGGANGGGEASWSLLRSVASHSSVPGGALSTWKRAHGPESAASTRAKAGLPSGPRSA